jgi:hypothetical protein
MLQQAKRQKLDRGDAATLCILRVALKNARLSSRSELPIRTIGF